MNSSIFNFEYLAAITRAPWRLKAWAFGLCAGAVLCVLLCSRFVAAAMDTPPARDRVAPPGTQVLLLGNSQYEHVSPAPFALPFFNASLPGSDYVIQEAILHAQVRKVPGIKCLLLGFDNIPLRARGITARKGDFSDLLDLGVAWYEIPEIPMSARLEYGIAYYPLFRPLLIGPRPDPFALETILFAHAQAAKLPPLPPRPETFDPNKTIPPFFAPPAGGAEKMRHYLRHLNRSNNLENNRATFLRMVSFCRNQGITLILLRGPTTKEFRDTRSPAWDAELDALYRDAVAHNGGEPIPLWNDDQNKDFPVYLYLDPNHLNGEGFLRYSQLLSIHLDSHIEENP